MMGVKCQVIRDLLPLYVDELTSEESNDLIKEHMQGCQACSIYLIQMRQESGEKTPRIDVEPDRDINKKIMVRIKKHIYRMNILFAILGALLGFYALGRADYSLVFWIYPLAGMIVYWALESFLLPAGIMLVFAALWGLFNPAQMGEPSELTMLLLSPVLTIVGSLIGLGIKKVFEREVKESE